MLFLAEPLAAADAEPVGFAPVDFGDFGGFPAGAPFLAGFAAPDAPDAGPDVPVSARDVVGLEPGLRARPDDERPSPRDPAPRPPGRAEAPGVDGRRFEGMVPIVPSRGPRPPQGLRRAGQRGRIHTKRSQPAPP